MSRNLPQVTKLLRGRVGKTQPDFPILPNVKEAITTILTSEASKLRPADL